MKTNILQATVVCNFCGWKKDNESVPNWHKKLCPECHKGIIVTNADLKIFQYVIMLMKVDTIFGKIFPRSKRKTVLIDTAPMRKGKSFTLKIKEE